MSEKVTTTNFFSKKNVHKVTNKKYNTSSPIVSSRTEPKFVSSSEVVVHICSRDVDVLKKSKKLD